MALTPSNITSDTGAALPYAEIKNTDIYRGMATVPPDRGLRELASTSVRKDTPYTMRLLLPANFHMMSSVHRGVYRDFLMRTLDILLAEARCKPDDAR